MASVNHGKRGSKKYDENTKNTRGETDYHKRRSYSENVNKPRRDFSNRKHSFDRSAHYDKKYIHRYENKEWNRDGKNDNGKRRWKGKNSFRNQKTSRDYDDDSNFRRHSKKFKNNNFDENFIQTDFDWENSMFFDDQGDQDYQHIFV